MKQETVMVHLQLLKKAKQCDLVEEARRLCCVCYDVGLRVGN